MRTATEEPWGPGAGPGALPARVHLRESTIADLYELHASTEAIAAEIGAFSGPAARRRLRQAKAAEADLMRVLGFATWEHFVGATGGPPVSPDDPPDDRASAGPALASEGSALAAVVAELGAGLLEELVGARAELRALRTDVADLGAELESASIEIIALRLELMVLASRSS